ncbi:MAG: hypothetical protein ABI429_05830 [Jatrophihabitantaceae bacterium]
MNSHRMFAMAALAALAAGAVGYGVASASTPTPKGPALPAAHAQPQAGNGNSPLPPAKPDSLFVPIKNCRIVNTAAAGGKIANGATRSFYIVGAAGFPTQGGPSGGCGIPASATAISARVIATGASADGAFVAYPTGTPVGEGTVYYIKNVNVSVGTNLQLGPGTGKVLTVKNVAGPAQLAIDVNGYYEEQIEGMISPSGSVYSGSNRLVSATHNGAGNYTVTVDSDVAFCTPNVTAYSGYVYASAYAFNSTHIQVYLWYLTGGVEHAYDGYFYVNVDC